MRHIRRSAFTSGALAAVAVGATLALTPPAAQAGQITVDVPAHRHFVVTPDGVRHAVGPQVCEHPDLQAAFNQFHWNIHKGAPFDAMNHPHNPAAIGAAIC